MAIGPASARQVWSMKPGVIGLWAVEYVECAQRSQHYLKLVLHFVRQNVRSLLGVKGLTLLFALAALSTCAVGLGESLRGSSTGSKWVSWCFEACSTSKWLLGMRRSLLDLLEIENGDFLDRLAMEEVRDAEALLTTRKFGERKFGQSNAEGACSLAEGLEKLWKAVIKTSFGAFGNSVVGNSGFKKCSGFLDAA